MTNLLRQWAGNLLNPDRRAHQMVMRSAPDHTIISGVFKGMRYLPPRKQQKSYMSRLLGTFELELQDAVNDLCNRPIDRIINVGAAEGYYAVGLARRCPNVRVVAFEAQEKNHVRLNKLIELNGVQDRVTTHGFCDVPSLNEQLQSSSLPAIVIDVEGGERVLLDPAAVPKVRSAVILVELHDFIDPTITDLIRQRFAATHNIQDIQARGRTVADFPLPISTFNSWIPEQYIVRMMSEPRPKGMHWYYMTPLAS